MKTKNAALSITFGLLGAAFLLTSESANAFTAPSMTTTNDYPFYKEAGNFGVGFGFGTSYEAFEYKKVCPLVPTWDAWVKECQAEASTHGNQAPVYFGYCLGGYATAKNVYCGKDGTYMNGSAYGNVTAKLFSSKKEIARVEAHATADSTLAKAGASLTVMGKDVVNVSVPARFERDFPFAFTFFKASASFGVGPFCVSASGEAVGTFGLRVAAQAGTAGLALTATPHAGIDVTVDASVGKLLVEVGVEGTLNLVEVELPATVALTMPNTSRVNWKADADITFNALAGKISLYADVCGDRVGSMSLFSWSGIPEKKYNIVDACGAFNL